MSAMSPDRLITMANQIGRFFSSQRHIDAPAEIADHLRQFWDPDMRDAIIAHGSSGGAGLDEPVRQAVARLSVTPSAG